MICGVVKACWCFVHDFACVDIKTAGECDTSKDAQQHATSFDVLWDYMVNELIFLAF